MHFFLKFWLRDEIVNEMVQYNIDHFTLLHANVRFFWGDLQYIESESGQETIVWI